MPAPEPGGGAAGTRSSGAAGRFGQGVLPIVAIAVFVSFTGAVLAAAGSTLGYDYLAYDAAARRVLAGQAVYDLAFQRAGGFGLFLYPPTFLPLVLPFAL